MELSNSLGDKIMSEVKDKTNNQLLEELKVIGHNHEQILKELEALIEIKKNLELTYAIYANEIKDRV